MSSETKKNKLVDYFTIGIVVVYIIVVLLIAYAASLSNNSLGNKVFFLLLLIWASIFGFIVPFNRYFKKGDLRKIAVILSLIIRLVLVTLFATSVYRIFCSKDYNLKYSYWLAAAYFVIKIIAFYIESSIKEYRKRKLEGKKRNILYFIASMLLVSFCLGISGYNSAINYLHHKSQLVLNNLKVPESITIYKHNRELGKVMPDFNSKIQITSAEDIRKILKDLQAAEITNLTGTSLINYSRMRDDNLPYYMLLFDYKHSDSWTNALEDGYIDYIAVTSNRNTVIEEMKTRNRLILGKGHFIKYFPISLSKDTMDMIFEYIKLQ